MPESVLIEPNDPVEGGKLTGRHVLLLLIGFFAVIIAINVVFTTLAVTSFRGEDVKKSYRQGLDYNMTLNARAAQSELGWSATVNIVGDVTDRTVIVKVSDASGSGLNGTEFTGRLRHPVNSMLDRPVTLNAYGDGMARIDVTGLLGQWTLEAMAVQGEDRFAFKRDLDLR